MSKKLFLCVMLIVLITSSMTGTVWADSPITSGEIDLSASVNPYDYAFPPDGIFPFLYDGTAPFLTLEIDTSDCKIDRLYIYDEQSDRVREVIDETVILYTETNDYLFFMTADKVLYQASYFDTTLFVLYQSSAEEVRDLNSYYQLLYFIEDNHLIRFLDGSTGTLETEVMKEAISTVFLLSQTELLINTIADEYLVYDRISDTVTEKLTEYQAVNRMNRAATASNDVPDVSLMSVYSNSHATQTNDISFPLSEYPANIPDNSQVDDYDYYQPISWFHVDGKEGCSTSNCKKYSGTGECEGFARYAHDAYLHIVDTSIGYSAWLTSKHSNSKKFNSSLDTIKDFFESLHTGAYVRYTKTSATNYHSIVFLCVDGEGIWVYEANQAYCSGSISYYGCGVQVRYYKYSTIANKYTGALHYINHEFTEDEVYYNGTYHKVGCPDCTGYVMQAHSGNYSYSYVSATWHQKIFSCCGGAATQSHTAATIVSTSSTKHERTYSCCGKVSEAHSSSATYTYTTFASATHHRVSRSCCTGYYTQLHTFNSSNQCTKCGYVKVSTNGYDNPVVME